MLIAGNTSDQRIKNSIAAGRVTEARIVRIDSFTPVAGADVEDMFEPDKYLDLYNKTFSKSLTLAALSGSDRIVKRIGRHDGEFDHGVVAAHFLRNLAESLAGLSGPGRRWTDLKHW